MCIYIYIDLLLSRRHYLGDRGESEGDIQQSENDLTSETQENNQEDENSEEKDENNEQEEKNTEDEPPPPLEDIDESEDEKENEIIESSMDIVTIEKPKDDAGRFELFN